MEGAGAAAAGGDRGITLERAAGVAAAGADVIAVVSDVLSNPDPEGRCTAWLEASRTWKKADGGT